MEHDAGVAAHPAGNDRHDAEDRPPAAAAFLRGHGGAGRAVVAIVALVLSAILVPIAVLGTWARAELVDTDRFVATFAPLAQDADVQAFVAAQAVSAIDAHADIAGTVDAAFSGIAELPLPDRARAALELLKASAASGVTSLLADAVHNVVASPAFADLWTRMLRQAHERAVAVIDGTPGTAVTLADDGTLSLDVGVVVARVKQHLTDQGVGIARLIPAVHKTVVIAASGSLVQVRTLYRLTVAIGCWLPWVVLALLLVGLAAARDRLRAVAWTGLGWTTALLALAAGAGVGEALFARAVSPSVMSAAAAHTVFDQLAYTVRATTVAGVVLALAAAVGAWFAGRSRSALAVRGAAVAGFGHVRSAADAHGLGTGRFGHAVHRGRTAILVLAVIAAALAVFFARPLTAGVVVAVVVCVLAVAVLVELLRRPAADDPPRRRTDQRLSSSSSGPRAK